MIWMCYEKYICRLRKVDVCKFIRSISRRRMKWNFQRCSSRTCYIWQIQTCSFNIVCQRKSDIGTAHRLHKITLIRQQTIWKSVGCREINILQRRHSSPRIQRYRVRCMIDTGNSRCSTGIRISQYNCIFTVKPDVTGTKLQYIRLSTTEIKRDQPYC